MSGPDSAQFPKELRSMLEEFKAIFRQELQQVTAEITGRVIDEVIRRTPELRLRVGPEVEGNEGPSTSSRSGGAAGAVVPLHPQQNITLTEKDLEREKKKLEPLFMTVEGHNEQSVSPVRTGALQTIQEGLAATPLPQSKQDTGAFWVARTPNHAPSVPDVPTARFTDGCEPAQGAGLNDGVADKAVGTDVQEPDEAKCVNPFCFFGYYMPVQQDVKWFSNLTWDGDAVADVVALPSQSRARQLREEQATLMEVFFQCGAGPKASGEEEEEEEEVEERYRLRGPGEVPVDDSRSYHGLGPEEEQELMPLDPKSSSDDDDDDDDDDEEEEEEEEEESKGNDENEGDRRVEGGKEVEGGAADMVVEVEEEEKEGEVGLDEEALAQRKLEELEELQSLQKSTSQCGTQTASAACRVLQWYRQEHEQKRLEPALQCMAGFAVGTSSQRPITFLSSERILQEGVRDMVQYVAQDVEDLKQWWCDKKLPALEAEVYKHYRKVVAADDKEERELILAMKEQHLTKLCEEMVNTHAENVAQYLKKRKALREGLKTTIDFVEEAKWKLALLRREVPPERPPRQAATSVRRGALLGGPSSGGIEDDMSSGDEEDSWLVPDDVDEEGVEGDDEANVERASPSRAWNTAGLAPHSTQVIFSRKITPLPAPQYDEGDQQQQEVPLNQSSAQQVEGSDKERAAVVPDEWKPVEEEADPMMVDDYDNEQEEGEGHEDGNMTHQIPGDVEVMGEISGGREKRELSLDIEEEEEEESGAMDDDAGNSHGPLEAAGSDHQNTHQEGSCAVPGLLREGSPAERLVLLPSASRGKISRDGGSRNPLCRLWLPCSCLALGHAVGVDDLAHVKDLTNYEQHGQEVFLPLSHLRPVPPQEAPFCVAESDPLRRGNVLEAMLEGDHGWSQLMVVSRTRHRPSRTRDQVEGLPATSGPPELQEVVKQVSSLAHLKSKFDFDQLWGKAESPAEDMQVVRALNMQADCSRLQSITYGHLRSNLVRRPATWDRTGPVRDRGYTGVWRICPDKNMAEARESGSLYWSLRRKEVSNRIHTELHTLLDPLNWTSEGGVEEGKKALAVAQGRRKLGRILARRFDVDVMYMNRQHKKILLGGQSSGSMPDHIQSGGYKGKPRRMEQTGPLMYHQKGMRSKGTSSAAAAQGPQRRPQNPGLETRDSVLIVDSDEETKAGSQAASGGASESDGDIESGGEVNLLGEVDPDGVDEVVITGERFSSQRLARDKERADKIEEEGKRIKEKLQKKRRVMEEGRVALPSLSPVKARGKGWVSLFKDKDNPQMSPYIHTNLKEHQLEAVRFMWKTLVENYQVAEISVEEDVDIGGCILAHHMGLGKTFSTIAFLHTLFAQPNPPCDRVLVVVPKNVLYNWKMEFEEWLPTESTEDHCLVKEKVFVLDSNDDVINEWHKLKGSALIATYDKIRRIVFTDREDRMELAQKLRTGSSIVVADEAHCLKSSGTQLVQCMKKFTTRRRIALTGYPLQNNLDEYYCMMSWVDPGYLPTLNNFTEEFITPILNGQKPDASPDQKRAMSCQLSVLQDILEDFVHRVGRDVLEKALPPKMEYVVLLKPTPIQDELYRAYLEQVHKARGTPGHKATVIGYRALAVSLLNCPEEFEMTIEEGSKAGGAADKAPGAGNGSTSTAQTQEPPRARGDAEGETSSDMEVEADDEVNTSTLCSSAPQAGQQLATESTKTRANLPPSGCQIILDNLRRLQSTQDSLSSTSKNCRPGWPELPKEIFVRHMIKHCMEHKEKLVIYTQRVPVLNHLERMVKNFGLEKDRDYLRLEGGTSAARIKMDVKKFNDSKCLVYLIMTKAGGVGINLAKAQRLVLYDEPWNPCDNAQATARVYRWGQDKPTFIYRLLYRRTIEHKIYERNLDKVSLFDGVVDKKYNRRDPLAADDANCAELYSYQVPEESAEDNAADAIEEHGDLAIKEVFKDTTLRRYLYKVQDHQGMLPPDPTSNLTGEGRRTAAEDYMRRNQEKPDGNCRRLKRLKTKYQGDKEGALRTDLDSGTTTGQPGQAIREPPLEDLQAETQPCNTETHAQNSSPHDLEAEEMVNTHPTAPSDARRAIRAATAHPAETGLAHDRANEDGVPGITSTTPMPQQESADLSAARVQPGNQNEPEKVDGTDRTPGTDAGRRPSGVGGVHAERQRSSPMIGSQAPPPGTRLPARPGLPRRSPLSRAPPSSPPQSPPRQEATNRREPLAGPQAPRPAALAPPAPQPFTGLVVVPTGLNRGQRDWLRSLVQDGGGLFELILQRHHTTHLVTQEARGEKYESARRWGNVHIVTRQWARDTSAAGRRMREEDYAVGVNRGTPDGSKDSSQLAFPLETDKAPSPSRDTSNMRGPSPAGNQDTQTREPSPTGVNKTGTGKKTKPTRSRALHSSRDASALAPPLPGTGSQPNGPPPRGQEAAGHHHNTPSEVQPASTGLPGSSPPPASRPSATRDTPTELITTGQKSSAPSAPVDNQEAKKAPSLASSPMDQLLVSPGDGSHHIGGDVEAHRNSLRKRKRTPEEEEERRQQGRGGASPAPVGPEGGQFFGGPQQGPTETLPLTRHDVGSMSGQGAAAKEKEMTTETRDEGDLHNMTGAPGKAHNREADVSTLGPVAGGCHRDKRKRAADQLNAPSQGQVVEGMKAEEDKATGGEQGGRSVPDQGAPGNTPNSALPSDITDVQRGPVDGDTQVTQHVGAGGKRGASTLREQGRSHGSQPLEAEGPSTSQKRSRKEESVSPVESQGAAGGGSALAGSGVDKTQGSAGSVDVAMVKVSPGAAAPAGSKERSQPKTPTTVTTRRQRRVSTKSRPPAMPEMVDLTLDDE